MDENDFQPGQPLYEKTKQGQQSGSSSRRTSKSPKGKSTHLLGLQYANLPARPSATYQMPTGVSQPLAYTFPVFPLPLTPSTYFIYRIQLGILSHEIVTQLYCAATIKERWTDVQETIRRIDRRLLSWRDKLTTDFDIAFEDTWTAPDWGDPNILIRMGLAMQFFSSRMILFRPCLCRFEGRMKTQSENSLDFNQEAVETCIRSARKMISLLSWSASTPQKLYAITPWWNTLHYICEALSVLMLEMAFKATHLPNEAADILNDAKKGINWLAMMAEQSVSARKAWEIFDSLIRLVAPMIRWSVFDMPTQAPVPPGYNWRRFNGALSPPSQPLSLPPAPSSHQTQSHQQTQTQQQQTQTQHQSTFANYETSQSQPTMAWQPSPQPQNYSFPDYHQSFEAANPLDHNTAISRFSEIGQVHGHYDDPWQHFFFPGSQGGGEMLMGGQEGEVDVMERQMGHGAGRVFGGYGGGPFQGSEGFDANAQFGGGGGKGGEGSSGGSGGSGNVGSYI
jgi:hypothetical protein